MTFGIFKNHHIKAKRKLLFKSRRYDVTALKCVPRSAVPHRCSRPNQINYVSDFIHVANASRKTAGPTGNYLTAICSSKLCLITNCAIVRQDLSEFQMNLRGNDKSMTLILHESPLSCPQHQSCRLECKLALTHFQRTAAFEGMQRVWLEASKQTNEQTNEQTNKNCSKRFHNILSICFPETKRSTLKTRDLSSSR